MKQTSQKILEAPLHFPEAQEQPIAFTNPTLSGLGELNGVKAPSTQAQHRQGMRWGLSQILTLLWTPWFLYVGGTWRHHCTPIRGYILAAKLKPRRRV